MERGGFRQYMNGRHVNHYHILQFGGNNTKWTMSICCIFVVFPIGRQMFSHFKERCFVICNSYLGRQNTVTTKVCLLSLLLSLSIYWWAQRHMVWDMPLVIWSQLCPLPVSSSPPTYSLQDKVGKREKLDAGQALFMNSKNPGVLSALFQPPVWRISPYGWLWSRYLHPASSHQSTHRRLAYKNLPKPAASWGST